MAPEPAAAEMVAVDMPFDTMVAGSDRADRMVAVVPVEMAVAIGSLDFALADMAS